jgi:hypothetical protein
MVAGAVGRLFTRPQTIPQQMQAATFLLSTDIKSVVVVVAAVALRFAAATVPTLSRIAKAVVTVATLGAGRALIKSQWLVSTLAANALAKSAGCHPFRELTV